MAKQKPPFHDPWQDLVRTRETRQVNLGDVLSELAIEERTARALKKALVARVAELASPQ